MNDFDKIYTEHASWLKRYVTLRVGSSDADDVVQDVWLEIHRSLASCRRSGIRAWMRTIAARAVYRHRRRCARGRSIASLPPFARERVVDPPPLEQRDTLRRELEQASMTRLSNLDPVEVVGLVWAEGRSVAEVARTMHESESTLHYLLGAVRAMAQRRRRLEWLLDGVSSRRRSRPHCLIAFAGWQERTGSVHSSWALQLSLSLAVAWVVMLGLPQRWVGATPVATEGALTLADERVLYWLDLPQVPVGVMPPRLEHDAIEHWPLQPEPAAVADPRPKRTRRPTTEPRREPLRQHVMSAYERPVLDLLELASHSGHDGGPHSFVAPESVAAQIGRLRRAVELSRTCRLELARRQLRSVDASLRHTHDRAIASYLTAVGHCREAT